MSGFFSSRSCSTITRITDCRTLPSTMARQRRAGDRVAPEREVGIANKAASALQTGGVCAAPPAVPIIDCAIALPESGVTVHTGERRKLIARLLDGERMAGLWGELGISHKTGYKILTRHDEIGLEGLTDRSRQPPGHVAQGM
jgi:leucine-zipper of insertion element IS481